MRSNKIYLQSLILRKKSFSRFLFRTNSLKNHLASKTCCIIYSPPCSPKLLKVSHSEQGSSSRIAVKGPLSQICTLILDVLLCTDDCALNVKVCESGIIIDIWLYAHHIYSINRRIFEYSLHCVFPSLHVFEMTRLAYFLLFCKYFSTEN